MIVHAKRRASRACHSTGSAMGGVRGDACAAARDVPRIAEQAAVRSDRPAPAGALTGSATRTRGAAAAARTGGTPRRATRSCICRSRLNTEMRKADQAAVAATIAITGSSFGSLRLSACSSTGPDDENHRNQKGPKHPAPAHPTTVTRSWVLTDRAANRSGDLNGTESY
jgi:hypothetical protein